MSAETQTPPAEATYGTVPEGRIARYAAAAEAFLERAADRLNPILVKETRQALKSRQFIITFALLLICGWAWSLIGIAANNPRQQFGTAGAELFCGYYVILAAALLVFVPFGAFRSLAAEQEDKTYELMSITTLGPRQIARGKLGSAVLQMLIYLSALSPCLAFTYMLRGIDFLSIVYFLFYIVLSSLFCSMIGVLAGTITTHRHWQVVVSVVLIAALLGVFIGAWAFVVAFTQWDVLDFEDTEFWIANAGIVTAFAGYFAMAYYAAVARLAFASDNRSTRLRVVMVAHHAVFCGWMAWAWVSPYAANFHEVALVTAIALLAAHWYVMGALMAGESPELSPRVKRSLPQSLLGRSLLTWLNPGPGTGYMLAVASMVGALVLVLLGFFVADVYDLRNPNRGSQISFWRMACFGLVVTSYVVFYLGLGLAAVRFLRNYVQVGLLMGVLTNILILTIGSGGPLIAHLMMADTFGYRYNLMLFTEPFWSSGHVISTPTGLSSSASALVVVVPLMALAVFFWNLPHVVAEVRHERVAKPPRVAEDDARRKRRKAPPSPGSGDPW